MRSINTHLSDVRSVRLQEDVIVLVPGFLGFRRIGQFPYFSDDIAPILQQRFEAQWHRRVSVWPVTAIPTGSLVRRVSLLAEHLSSLISLGAERLYLVGHSTGGVDANLLMTEWASRTDVWTGRLKEVQERVQAVVTISAPHYGTSLLDSRVGRFLANPLAAPGGLIPFVRSVPSLGRIAVRDIGVVSQALKLTPAQSPDLVHFLASVVRDRRLMHDLSPDSMATIRQLAVPVDATPTICFVSGTDKQQGENPSDPFFVRLLNFCAEHVTDHPEVTTAIARLGAADESMWVGNIERSRFAISRLTSDGIVNTSRQLLKGAKLGGIIQADHCDVIGDYDRADQSDRPERTGLFHSGAGFGDGQLHELYHRVADSIALAGQNLSAQPEKAA